MCLCKTVRVNYIDRHNHDVDIKGLYYAIVIDNYSYDYDKNRSSCIEMDLLAKLKAIKVYLYNNKTNRLLTIQIIPVFVQ